MFCSRTCPWPLSCFLLLFFVLLHLLHLLFVALFCLFLAGRRAAVCRFSLVTLLVLAYSTSREAKIAKGHFLETPSSLFQYFLVFDVNTCCWSRVVPGHSTEARAGWTAASVHSNAHSNVGYLKIHLDLLTPFDWTLYARSKSRHSPAPKESPSNRAKLSGVKLS